MTVYFITRHPGALEWAKQSNITFDVHATHLFSLERFQAGDKVIGTLPINLIYQLNQAGVRYFHLSLVVPSELRGVELNAKQLVECQASLEEYVVCKHLV